MNSILFVPHGYLIVTTGMFSDEPDHKGCEGIRWSVMSANSKTFVQNAQRFLKSSLDMYPSLKGGEYEEWLGCVEKVLLPGAS